MEASGRIPEDLIESLKTIGLFRMFVPRSHDGLELDLFDCIEIIQHLARIDGSIAWLAAITSGVSLVTTLLPPETYEKIYKNGPDVIFAGSLRPNTGLPSSRIAWRSLSILQVTNHGGQKWKACTP